MVFISDCNKMFWGVTIDAGKRYSQTVQQGFHVSMAALEISAKKPSENVQVMLQRDSTEYLLCTLHNNLLQQPLDLNFATGEEVSFSLNGAGVVHLTGYLIYDEEPSISEFSDDEEAPSLVDSSGDGQMIGLKRKAVAPVSNAKKIKLLDEFDDDDDEDDEDYSEEEEGFSDEDDDDDDDDDSEDEFFDEDDSFDDEDDESDEEEKSPEKKVHAEKTSAKSPKAVATPVSQKNKKQEANVAKQEKTPKQQGSAKQNGKAQKLNTSTPAQKAPETPATPSGETESAKKKKKKKKKKNKSENDSMNASNTSTPGTPATPNKSESTPSGTPKKKIVAGGTIVEDLKTGHGPEAKPGKMVSVFYVGTLAKSNKRFDSCTDGKPFRFRLNQGEVIKGWDVGLTGMKVGGKRRITVPPSQGYGNNKQGPIPPNSTLVFEVELKAVS